VEVGVGVRGGNLPFRVKHHASTFHLWAKSSPPPPPHRKRDSTFYTRRRQKKAEPVKEWLGWGGVGWGGGSGLVGASQKGHPRAHTHISSSLPLHNRSRLPTSSTLEGQTHFVLPFVILATKQKGHLKEHRPSRRHRETADHR